MSAPTVLTQLTNPDPNQVNPVSMQDLVDILNPLLTSAIQGTFVPYVVSSNTPAVADQDKVWLQLDGAGRPLKIKFFYNGNWRRFYDGNYGELRTFIGDPTNYFDATGLGLIGLDWDGFAVCNGNNGTPNLADRFVVWANNHATIDGYSAGNWLSTVTGTAVNQGGNSDFTLVNTNLPSMKVFVTGNDSFDTNGGGKPIQIIVTGKTDGNNKTTPDPVASFGADPTANPPVPQIAVPTVPPFVAACPVLFIGYA